jgi:pilus assembly protein TadC
VPDQTSPTQKRGLTALDGALALIALLLIVQMWLLTATLESYLAGHHEAALPAAIISGVIFMICGALYAFVVRIDSEARRARQKERQP